MRFTAVSFRSLPLLLAVLALLVAAGGCKRDAESGAKIVLLADLTAGAGMRIDGGAANDNAGWNLAAVGDLNGDGVGDFLVSAIEARAFGAQTCGEVYLVFGGNALMQSASTHFPALIAETASVRIVGGSTDGADTGRYLGGLGDVNGDGINDFYVSSGATGFVVFGGATLTAAINDDTLNLLTELPIGSGATIAGNNLFAPIGDVNGDQKPDFAVHEFGPNRVVVIFGGTTFATATADGSFDLTTDLSASTGAELTGFAGFGASVDTIAAAGDVNGDGIGDFLLAQTFASPQSRTEAGIVWLIFGRANLGNSPLDVGMAPATQAVRIHGVSAGEKYGAALSGGDVNGDGYADFVIAPGGHPGGSGASRHLGVALIFGGVNVGSNGTIDLANLVPPVGCMIEGDMTAASQSQTSAAIVGDMNGDGYGDIAILACADTGASLGPRIYVVLGNPYFYESAEYHVGEFENQPRIWRFDEPRGDATDYFPASQRLVAAGDVNGDGRADLLIGNLTAKVGDRAAAGQIYLIFGTAE